MRKFIGITAAAALLAGASLVAGGSSTHAFAATNCPTSDSGSTGDFCTQVSSVAINANNAPYQLSGVFYSDFVGVTLNGVDQPTQSSSNNKGYVLDASGTGTGWNVTVQASPLLNSAKSDTIAAPNISTDPAVSSTCSGAGTCRGDAAPFGIGGVIDSGSAVKVLSASANNGMGQYFAQFGNLHATIPANVYAGTYSTTITVTLVGGTP